MRLPKSAWIVPVAMLGLWASVGWPEASLSVFSYDAKSNDTIYKTPEDILPRIPVINWIPRQLRLERYTVDLRWNDFQLNHRAYRKRTTRDQDFWFGMSYAEAVSRGDGFSSRLDVPLWSSDSLGTAWHPANWGDYNVHLLRSDNSPAGLRVSANARFP